MRLLQSMVLIGLTAIAGAQGGDEQLPPALDWGPPTLHPPPPPPPPQPAVAPALRVAYVPAARGTMRLRLEAWGAPGTPFLIGAVQPNVVRPVIVAAGRLDSDGRWSFERELTTAQARALSAVELVLRTR